MSASGSGNRVVATAALVAGAGLLAVSAWRPASGACDPVIGMAQAAFALAQVAALAALILLRGAGLGRATLGLIGAAWALASACILAMRAAAGSFGLASVGDLVFAGLGGAALAMLAGGLSDRARAAGGRAVAAMVVAVAALAATWLADARATDRIWRSWARLQMAGDALDAARAELGRLPLEQDVPLERIAGILPASIAADLALDDAWGEPLRYTLTDGEWTLVSLGKDGRPGPYSAGPSRDFVDDLVLHEGSPVAWPESPCAKGDRPPPTDPLLKDQRGRRRR